MIDKDELLIRRLASDDVMIAEQLIGIFKDVFDHNDMIAAKPSYLKTLLRRHEFVCIAAIYKGEVIGGLTAYELPMYYSEYTDLFIYDIAVKAALQQNGIGSKLLEAIKDWGKQNYIREIFVDADEEDVQALDFYRSTQGFEAKTVQFTFKLNRH
ncbi:GNAT family N-acetyltransferase [Mucilaginibacter dorajii]|uniref:N-acetyltransferase domain-containing protein n=1 Tax=Mucilaginibacter dorajii TaxID=692994 RepID=A0ABP7PGW7_9SPHI|nr:GNAT family N-acetyltransferase [Mucilaginibacter dorajii]MCS3735486.1 aminoglycoside 3-N-acetyltransferase I [Mucilaginibacter dorajii]